MTNELEKQIKLDGSFIPMEEAIKAGLVPSKRLDRIDKLEIDLANYEQMERDIEKIIEPYQLNWELDCLSLPTAIQSILERKEQECEAYKMEAEEGKEINAELKAENEELKKQHQADKGLITSTGKQNYQLLQEYDKLKTALTEIKEIAKNGCYDDCGMPLDELSIILQKISECEGNDET